MKIIINGKEAEVDGSSLPRGGATDQILAKASNADGDVKWADIPEAGEVYSTEETRIGTWIDGKPIYRRVVTFTTPTALNVATRVYTGFNYVKQVISLRCIVNQAPATANVFIQLPVPISTASTTEYPSSSVYVQAGQSYGLYVRIGRDIYAGAPAVAIVDYTKTTD